MRREDKSCCNRTLNCSLIACAKADDVPRFARVDSLSSPQRYSPSSTTTPSQDIPSPFSQTWPTMRSQPLHEVRPSSFSSRWGRELSHSHSTNSSFASCHQNYSECPSKWNFLSSRPYTLHEKVYALQPRDDPMAVSKQLSTSPF